MKKEYVTTGEEFGRPVELSQPREDMGAHREYFETHTEYWKDGCEYTDEMEVRWADHVSERAAEAKQKKRSKLLKKMVYGVASAATVFTMAQTIDPSFDVREPVQQEQDSSAVDRGHQTVQPVDKPVQEALQPASIITISCSGELTKEVVQEELAKYDLSEPFGVLLEGNITRIGKRAFQDCKNLVQVEWPDSVKEIGEMAFYACNNLVFEHLDTSGLLIGNNAFSYSTIEELLISDSFEAEYTEPFEWANVKSISYEPGLKRMPDYILNGVFTLETLEVPAGVTEIGQRAIANCRDLREVTLPEGVTLLGKNAFYDCDKLTTVNLPGSLETIREQAFYNCKQLVFERLDTAGLLIGNNAFSYSTIEELVISADFEAEYTEPFEWANVKSVSYEPGLKRMPDYILNGVFILETLEVPAGVTEIGQRAIANCRDLREVTLPEGVILLGKNAFYDCDKLTTVSLPESLETIREQAFYNCKQLVFERLDTAGLLIGNNAFSYSTIEELVISADFEAEYTEPFEWANVKSVSYEPGLTCMPDYILNGAYALETLELPAGIREVGRYSAANCRDLRQVILPEGITLLDECAFYDCNKLTTVNLPESLQTINGHAFYGCEQLVVERLDMIGLAVYNRAFGYTTIHHLVISDDFEANVGSAFEYANVDTVSFEEGITRIPNLVLDGARGVTTLIIPEGVTEIGHSAFHNCKDVTTLQLPQSLRLIEASAFFGCDGLTEVRIPNAEVQIKLLAFKRNDSLVLSVVEGSPAQEYAIMDEIQYVVR